MQMTLSEDLVKELGEAVERVPTTMGTDIVLAVVSAVGPSLTIVTTRFFSPETFRDALHRWCGNKNRLGPVHISGERRGSKFLLDLDECTAAEMGPKVAEFVAEFLEIHPDGPGRSASIKP